MRAIEFRGKRIDNGKWVYGYYIFANGDSKMLIDRTSSKPSEWVYENVSINNHLIAVFTPPDIQGWDYGTQLKFYKVIPDTIGQFTGLLDKNGNKIFEGDKVRDLLSNAEYTVRFGYNLHAAYTGWCLEPINFDCKYSRINADNAAEGKCDNDNFEIIGNIHEGGEQ